MLKTIIFTTSHPAPYLDIIYASVAQNSKVIVYYNREKDSEKTWKENNFFQGKISTKTNCFVKLKDIKKCDFAVLGGWNYKINWMFFLLLLIYKKPFAFFSDVPDTDNITPLKIKLKKRFFKFVPFLFITGTTCKEHYKKCYNVSDEKLVVFPYGVKLPKTNEVQEIITERRSALKKGDSIKILIANRFIQRKGYETLIEAIKILNKENLLNNIDITIIGHGELFERFKNILHELSDNIKLLGWVEFKEYEKLLQQTDIYIHSSYFEPYGIPVVDAMLNGKLVIASDGVMSALDNIITNYNGLIYPKYEAKKLASILEEIIYNKNMISELGSKAININEKFKIDYHKIIADIVSTKIV